MSLIYSAEYVISNSFHAVAFALIFKKNFLVVDRFERINTRMRDLMTLLELNQYHLKFNGSKNLDEVDIDFDEVYLKLNSHILRSKDFLLNSLKL